MGKNVKLISAFAIVQSPPVEYELPIRPSLWLKVFAPKFIQGVCSVAIVAFLNLGLEDILQ